MSQLQWAHRVICAELHGCINGIHRADTFVKNVDGFVDHRQQDAVNDEGREIFRDSQGLVEAGNEFARTFEGGVLGRDTAVKIQPASSPAPN